LRDSGGEGLLRPQPTTSVPLTAAKDKTGSPQPKPKRPENLG
jgi:hypothetical protein